MLNDIHLSKDNIPEFLLNWEEALSVCEEAGIRRMAVGGDLFLSRSSQTLGVLLAAHDAFTAACGKGISVYLANGNHDKVDPEALRGYCHIFGRHGNVFVADDYLTLSEEGWGFSLHMMAYFPENGSFMEKLEALVRSGLDDKRKNYLYLHEGINGALAHSTDTGLPAHIFKDFDRVFAGHYHNRCAIRGTAIEYIGASRQHNFGEDEEKGYTILSSDGTCRFIRNRVNKRYKVIEAASGSAGIHLADRIEELRADGRNMVKVRILSPGPGCTVDRDLLLKAGASRIEIVYEEQEQSAASPSSLLEKYDMGKIREAYRTFCKEKKIGDVSTGLAYLSKINNDNICGN